MKNTILTKLPHFNLKPLSIHNFISMQCLILKLLRINPNGLVAFILIIMTSNSIISQNINYDYKLNNTKHVCPFCQRKYITSEIHSLSNINFDKNNNELKNIRDAIAYTITLDLWNVNAGWTVANDEECPSVENRTAKHQWRDDISIKSLSGATSLQIGNENKKSIENKFKGNYGFIYKGLIETILYRVYDKIDQNESFKNLKDEEEKQKKLEADNIILKGEVKIGNQIWMVKNLNVDKFNNGDLIPQAKTNDEWKRAAENKQPAWCYYKNDPANAIKYGKLYNWYAIDDPRGIAPSGWHLPTIEEWQELNVFLKVSSGDDKDGITGSKLKSTNDWKQNLYVSNSSNFSALPGGSRANDGYFCCQGYHGYWGSSTDKDEINALSIHMADYPNDLEKLELKKSYAVSLRCLKGEESQKKREERQKKVNEAMIKLEIEKNAKLESEAKLKTLQATPLSKEEELLLGEWTYDASDKNEKQLVEISINGSFSQTNRDAKFIVSWERYSVTVSMIYGVKVITKNQKINTQINEINGFYGIADEFLNIIVSNNKIINSNFDSKLSTDISNFLNEIISMKIETLKSSKIKLVNKKYNLSFSGKKLNR